MKNVPIRFRFYILVFLFALLDLLNGPILDASDRFSKIESKNGIQINRLTVWQKFAVNRTEEESRPNPAHKSGLLSSAILADEGKFGLNRPFLSFNPENIYFLVFHSQNLIYFQNATEIVRNKSPPTA